MTAPEPVWRPPVPAQDDYQVARSLAAAHSMQQLVMAAMLTAPKHLSTGLMALFPGQAAILRTSYSAPGAYSGPAAGQ